MKNNEKLIKISLLFLSLFLSYSAHAAEIYVPEPIIFVHGLSSDETVWDSTKSELRKYFIDEQTGVPKYEYKVSDEKSYFPHCDYEIINTGDISSIALGVLKRSIYNGLENIPDEYPNKKVIIVAHSMGGLVTRSLLKQQNNFQNSIDKVIFIGTPHSGSPYASVLWLLNKVKNETLPPLIKENYLYTAIPAFSLSNFFNSDRLAYLSLGSNLLARYFTINMFCIFANLAGTDPGSPAIDQLRLDSDVTYASTIYGISPGKVKSVQINVLCDGTDAFTSDANNNLAVPNSYETIIAQNISPTKTVFAVKELLKCGDAFIFPSGESLDNVYVNGGDGIVSLGSQARLGNVGVPLTDVSHIEEPGQTQAFLDAIDDSLVIETMYVVSADKTANSATYPVYIVAKVKEYLLADVEISSIIVDGVFIDPSLLSEFFNPSDGTSKPYYKFNKNFLKERPDTNLRDKDNSPITLYPGEFYFELDLQGDSKHNITLKMKNPAAKESNSYTLTVQRPIITDERPTGTMDDLRPEISARIYSGLGAEIDLSSVQMKLDGSSVSYSSSGSASNKRISFTPTYDLTEGTHTVIVNGRDISGLPAEETTWTFTVEDPPPPLPGYFKIEIPAKITIDQDFSMKIIAYNGFDEAMDGNEGRELYNESANITISGTPPPQGNLLFTQANAGEWTNGVWHVTNQRYVNSQEEEYKLTITVTDAGGAHAGMTGEAHTIVDPLKLVLEVVGAWGIDGATGNWEAFNYVTPGVSTSLYCGAWYFDNRHGKRYWKGGAAYSAYLYKAEIPPGSNIDNIAVVLTRNRYSRDFENGSIVYKEIGFSLKNRNGIIPDAPPDVPAEIKIDYSFNSPIGYPTPIGEHNLLHEVIGGMVWRRTPPYYGRPTSATGDYWGTQVLRTTLPWETLIEYIPISDSAISTVWITIYFANIQFMKAQVEPHAIATLYDREQGYSWSVGGQPRYSVDGIYGYKENQ